jgi:serine/threonine protein kinase
MRDREPKGSPERHPVVRYVTTDVLARTNKSVVYKGVNPTTGQEVAIKKYLELDAMDKVRYKREIDTLALVSHHPGFPDVYAVGEDANDPYIVMELMEGSLTDLIGRDKAPLPVDEIHTMLRDVADALGYLHGHGFIHRDIKPANILRKAGRYQVTDLGITKKSESEQTSEDTSTDIILGTPTHLSPEQVLGEPLTPRSDVYSLGIVLYQTLTGRPPFVRSAAYPDEAKLAEAQVDDTVPLHQIKISDDSSAYEKETKLHFLDIAIKATSKAPEDRYQTMREFDQAINNAVSAMRIKHHVPRHLASESITPMPRWVDPVDHEFSTDINAALRAPTVVFPIEPQMPLRAATANEAHHKPKHRKKAKKLRNIVLSGLAAASVVTGILFQRDSPIREKPTVPSSPSASPSSEWTNFPPPITNQPSPRRTVTNRTDTANPIPTPSGTNLPSETPPVSPPPSSGLICDLVPTLCPPTPTLPPTPEPDPGILNSPSSNASPAS